MPRLKNLEDYLDYEPSEMTGDFFEDSIEAFGYDQARMIGATIVGSFVSAQKEIPLLEPIKYVKIGLLETGYINGFASSSENRVLLNISPSLVNYMEFLTEKLPQTIWHEVAHIAHGQHNPNFMKGIEPGWRTLLGFAFKEGIAEDARFRRQGSYSAAAYQQHPVLRKREPLVLAALAELAGRDIDNPNAYHCDFLFGEMGLPVNGYQIGRYAITKIVADHGLDQRELMQAPFEDLEILFETAA